MELNSVPRHVAIIMDGNGRWAKEKGLIRSMGHEAGCENLKHLASHIYDLGIKYLSIYAIAYLNNIFNLCSLFDEQLIIKFTS